MTFTIRKGNQADFPAILDLIKALALFENAPEQVTNTVAQMKEEQALFNTFVVENEQGKVIAMMLYYYVYYTWVGKSLYLDDLYVQEAYRGNGLGKKLLKKLFEEARKNKCKRVRWQVLDWNKPAIDFYKKLGATLDGEWINCDFDTDKITNF
jgi:GNAT superfamily N-acetyltransferase